MVLASPDHYSIYIYIITGKYCSKLRGLKISVQKKYRVFIRYIYGQDQESKPILLPWVILGPALQLPHWLSILCFVPGLSSEAETRGGEQGNRHKTGQTSLTDRQHKSFRLMLSCLQANCKHQPACPTESQNQMQSSGGSCRILQIVARI